MTKYDFSALNDKEFEEFICELMNKHYLLELQSFKPGKDAGIDLRCSTSKNNNAIVVQAKQYYTKFNDLFSKLKNEELAKVQKLNPEQYWLVTSLPLSAANKDAIAALFKGFMPDANFVLGREDLNKLLNKHKSIEKNWLKLWLSNTSVLKRMLNNGIYNRSEFYEEKIVRTVKCYVKNHSLDDAAKILKKNKFLLITGQPGVGKTTLANMVTYQFLAQEYQLVYINKDIAEADDVFTKDKDARQLFYFDDFLGRTHLELLNHTGSSESSIVNFIEKIQFSRNKYLIMTTRTTILNDAREHLEKIRQARLDLNKQEIRLSDYNLKDKGQILYNHIFHADIGLVYKEVVLKDKNYWKIIRHKNYTPRLIEFICKPYNISEIEPSKYLSFILNALTYPELIWEHSFTKQLRAEDRFLIGSLYSFGNHFRFINYRFDSHIRLDCLELGYNARVNYEVKNNGHTRSTDSFNKSLKHLLDGYLLSYVEKDTNVIMLGFINPSIDDFLLQYFKRSNEEKWKLVNGAAYLAQLKFCYNKLFSFTDLGFDIYEKETLAFLQFINKDPNHFKATIHLDSAYPIAYQNAFNCELAELYYDLKFTEEINLELDPLIISLVSKVDLNDLNNSAYDILLKIIKEPGDLILLEKYVMDNWEKLIIALWPHGSNSDKFEELEDLFKNYNQNLRAFINHPDHMKMFYDDLSTKADDETISMIYSNEDNIKSLEELDELKEKVLKTRNEIFEGFYMEDKSYDESYYFRDLENDEKFTENRTRKKKPVKINTTQKDKEKADVKEMEEYVENLFTMFE
ncbi:restriction endonuclease [Arachidicoccus sp.]|uniref:nSTAND3 domain-containing NTPase n=1 Tax=Arachidicoccus sp. TaxID=1872624 RepID=UPI003D1A4B68